MEHKGGNLSFPNVKRRRGSRVQRFFIYVTLFTFAVVFSTVLQTPWSFFRLNNASKRVKHVKEDPASQWKDDVWPLRPQTPWDISTDYPYPRSLEYDVQEGTWLRLDVHPKSGDIVFDMLGDLYCLPGHVAYTGDRTRARPILLGVPHDSDPHFSPEGDRLIFRSDAVSGVENIWVTKWTGCDDMDIRPMVSKSDILKRALDTRLEEESLLSHGVPETPFRRLNRLVREGRHDVQRVTNETYRWVTDPRFHPSGKKIIATKWFTSSRSLGAGEGWEYSVPSLNEIQHESGKRISGSQVIGRTLPLGWTVDDYANQQIGPEQLIWHGNDSIIYSKNVVDESTFAYSKDVHTGIYAIFQKNLVTGDTETLVDAFPGGASRPEISRDGRTLAFVRRVRDKEALVLKDLTTGTLHHVWYGLTYDASSISAPMGTYPSFAFTPQDDAVIIWAAGQIYSVPVSTNALGEKIASEISPFPIRFTAHIEKRLAKTLRGGTDIVGLETQATQRVRSFKELRVDSEGKNAVFQAAGETYIQKVGSSELTKVPVLHKNAPYYSPSFVYGAEDLILHARWSNTNFTSFELADVVTGMAFEFEGVPIGRYFSPVLCECTSMKRRIAFIRGAGSSLTGNAVATANPGLYVGEIILPPKGSLKKEKIVVRDLHFVPSEINADGRVNIRFLENNSKLLVQQSDSAFTIDLATGPDKFGKYTHGTLASGKMSSELVVSPQVRKHGKHTIQNAAFVDFFNVYLAPGDAVKKDQGLWSKPGNATRGLARLSLDGGHDITFSGDGKKLFWFLGALLHSLQISQLDQCRSQINHDHSTFGISCVKNVLKFQEIVVEHSTDIARLKKDASIVSGVHKDWIQGNNNDDVVVILNATLLTMASGDPSTDLIYEGVLVTRGGVIEDVGTLKDVMIPHGAITINAQGGFVIPGFIDVHAHWNGFSDRYPAASWEMQTFLAYGVTTLHNPSADNVEGFDERSRIERGQLIGPRIFTVGDIIYGAGAPGIHQDIVDFEEARSALLRIKAEGGPSSISYKNYNLPSRASRQRLLLSATDLNMLCVPEGGMNYDWDLTYIVDGMTTVEHPLPIPTLYEDVLQLFVQSGTGSTPTHVVNYGGVHGEQLVWATEDLPNDPKLRRFTRHDILEQLSESTSRPFNSYTLFNTSTSTAKMVKMGLLAHIGAHGEPPLGVNYHAEMAFTKSGGLSNYEVLRAATSSGAITLGIFPSLGSLSPGKLADFLVYPDGVDLLNDHVLATRDILYVARGGRIWDASTMHEVWPLKGKQQKLPPFNAD